MNELPQNQPETVNCPICGSIAEAGCLYGPDTMEVAGELKWIAGDPSWKKNSATAFGKGETVGQNGWLTGPHATGIRCMECRRIILEF
jgi:hypothetical protein